MLKPPTWGGRDQKWEEICRHPLCTVPYVKFDIDTSNRPFDILDRCHIIVAQNKERNDSNDNNRQQIREGKTPTLINMVVCRHIHFRCLLFTH